MVKQSLRVMVEAIVASFVVVNVWYAMRSVVEVFVDGDAVVGVEVVVMDY